VVESIQNTLEIVRTGIEEAVQAAHEKIDVLKQGILAVEHIVVYGSTDVFVKNKHSRSKSTPGSRTTRSTSRLHGPQVGVSPSCIIGLPRR
jgi:hypothetical protein